MEKSKDMKVFASAMAKLGAAFGVEITEPMLSAYWEALAPKMDVSGFVSACAYLRDTKEFMPKICHFVEASRADSKKEAERQWQLVLHAAKSSSWTGEKMADKIIRCMGGPRQFGDMTNNEIHTWARKQFMELWENFEDSDEKSLYKESCPKIDGFDEGFAVEADKLFKQIANSKAM